nr:CD2 antigen cytoplasmic tail-binding protein 2 isoform X2 [Ipomoea batatas]
MEEGGPQRSRKRPFVDTVDDDSQKPSAEKRVRFPKGKKLKRGDYVVDGKEELPSGWKDPRLAAKERAMRRSQITADLLDEGNRGMIHNIALAEEAYEDNETFVEDGIQIEPFNLDKEREEGYFDANGNYVEYVNENDIKDAWLDSIDVHPKATKKTRDKTANEDEARDLTSEEIGKIKRRIADVLEPGEKVLQALRRLKGTSNNKEKMSAENKQLFDQLTEDAMKLLENGDYNVYDERQESFQREAEGYERLAQAKALGTSMELKNNSGSVLDEDFIPSVAAEGPSSLSSVNAGPSNPNASAAMSNGDDSFDMFAEDDENPPTNPTSSEGTLQNDYVYDESSGYYYSSSLGYYYDPSSGLYCNAASGQWYSYKEESGTYEEVPQAQPQPQPEAS